MSLLIWILFCLAILALLALDLGVIHKKPAPMYIGEALAWTLFWILLALAFNILVYFLYQHYQGDGQHASLQFFAGYLLEKSLSLDNIFVMALIFTYFRVPIAYQHRVLTWGVMGALIMRLIMILAGTALVLRFNWMLFVFGAFLVFSAVKMLLEKEEVDPQRGFFVSFIRKRFPITDDFRDDHFFVKENGQWKATPLLLTLIQVEAFDLLFAIDSIPAIFAVTSDPFIIFTSNVFAVLGLRSLYFALAGLLEKFRFLKLSLVFVLLFIGIKMLIGHFYPISVLTTLSLIVGLLGGGAIISMVAPPRPAGHTLTSPLAADLQELAILTWGQARRIVTLVVGITVLLIGIVMLVTPGPAIIVIPLGLLILAREFVWARRLLHKAKEKGSHWFRGS